MDVNLEYITASLLPPLESNLDTILLLLLSVLLILLNGFFVAAEFAILRVRDARIRELEEDGNTAAKLASDAIKHLDLYLSAAQLGITLTSLGLGWMAFRVVDPMARWLQLGSGPAGTAIHSAAYVIAFGVFAFFHLVFGTLVPRALAVHRTEHVTLKLAFPMALFSRLVSPLVVVLNAAAAAVLRMCRITPAGGRDLAHSEEELRTIISASGSGNGGTLQETQAELLDNVFDFAHRLARQVMIHRTEILALDVDDTLEENFRHAQEGEHSRYPVIREDIDTVIGFVHTKDLFALYQRDPHGDIRTVMREMLIMPETIRVDLLLRQLQRVRQHMAILIDEYGGTAGLVTVADLLEELVGDLPDEFEPLEEEWIIRVDERTVNVDGRLPLDELEELLGEELPCGEACDTAGGYAYWAFGRIPETNDTVEVGGLALRVLALDGRRVSRLEITRAARDEETTPVTALKR